MKENIIKVGIIMGYAAALTAINKTTEMVADKLIKEKELGEDATEVAKAKATKSKKIKTIVLSNVVTFAAAIPLSAVATAGVARIDGPSDTPVEDTPAETPAPEE